LVGQCLVIRLSAESLQEFRSSNVPAEYEGVGKHPLQSTLAGPEEIAKVASTAPKARHMKGNGCSKQSNMGLCVLVQRRMFTNRSNPLTDEVEDAPGRNNGKAVVEETENKQTQSRKTQEVLSKTEAATDQKPMPPTMVPPKFVPAMAEESGKRPATAKEGAKQSAAANVAVATPPAGYQGVLLQPRGTTNLGKKNGPVFIDMTNMDQSTLQQDSQLINLTTEEGKQSKGTHKIICKRYAGIIVAVLMGTCFLVILLLFICCSSRN